MVKNQNQDNPKESEEEDVSTNLVSHADAASALDLTLRYVEQHAATTSTDVMLCGAGATWHRQAGTRFFRLGGFSHSSQRGISITSVECATKRTFSQSGSINESDMGKKKKAFPSETSPKKKLKVEATEEKKLIENKRKRPNYFVAVQISNPDIHEAIQRIQDHIISQNMQFIPCMNSIATLHITLMVMSITDTETHDRALKALRNVHEECNDEMSKNPLRLEFCGLGHFRNRICLIPPTFNMVQNYSTYVIHYDNCDDLVINPVKQMISSNLYFQTDQIEPGFIICFSFPLLSFFQQEENV
ncbi:hypothetical protein AVEN_115225-1 [Araneus ventricosus]|uniref:A-kinase anchor protein 7-like phosphoesterase domain-containing protein n=1 Tax=Araneus ventricosus TaxID=182803 RepID=A0A4Y1ZXQ4_ARAVE|nr:hypothetical protein AVEN_115225-1 [Araneus ventricosus]